MNRKYKGASNSEFSLGDHLCLKELTIHGLEFRYIPHHSPHLKVDEPFPSSAEKSYIKRFLPKASYLGKRESFES
jgi:hypothetical protein